MIFNDKSRVRGGGGGGGGGGGDGGGGGGGDAAPCPPQFGVTSLHATEERKCEGKLRPPQSNCQSIVTETDRATRTRSDRKYTHLFQRPDPHTLVLPLALCRVLLSHITVPLSLTLHLAPPPHGAARPEHTGQRSRLTICRTYKEEREPYTVALPVALS